MTYSVHCGGQNLGTITANNADQALVLAKNKYREPIYTDVTVEEFRLRIPNGPDMHVDTSTEKYHRRYDWLGLGAKLAAVAMIYTIGALHGMKIMQDRHPAPAKVEEVKVETPAPPKVIVTNVGHMTKFSGEGNDIRIETEHAILYVNRQFPAIWTSECHIVNDGNGKVWFTEDGLPLMYEIIRQ